MGLTGSWGCAVVASLRRHLSRPPSAVLAQLPLALKIDRNPEVKTVKGEYSTLRRLQAGCRQVVRVHDAAKHAGRWLMTMELLGPNLAAVRRSTLSGRLDATTAKARRAESTSSGRRQPQPPPRLPSLPLLLCPLPHQPHTPILLTSFSHTAHQCAAVERAGGAAP